ncbi:MAG: CoA transferase [Rhodobacterales bacterium]|nr:MAG: CoA transferase [Rhodobacterales bacterium]
MSRPLEGLRVVELARILAGPWAGQTLADLGAEVIKVEAPEGDDIRRWGPPNIDTTGEETAAYYHATNRGKRSVCIDFRTEEGAAQLRNLIESADILIENFKVGGLAKYGFGYDDMSKLNPRLIYCSVTGFGQDGPYAPRAGYDFIIQGMSGLMSVTGDPSGQPQKMGVPITDLVTGLYATNAILAALYRRKETGRGDHIDMALLDCALAISSNQAMNYFATGKAPVQHGNAHPNIVPYQVFDCADGHVIIAVGNDGQFARLCDQLGVPELATNPDYATNPARLANRTALIPLLEPLIAALPRDEILRRCEAGGVPAGPINGMDQVFDDPQVIARGMKVDLNGTPSVRSPIRFREAQVGAERPSPVKGEGQDLLD